MQRHHRRSPLILAVAVLTAVVGSLATAVPKASAADPLPNADHMITYCHATPADTAAQGWIELTTSVHVYLQAGHDEHAADIIPAFDYWGEEDKPVSYGGKNLDAFGQAVLANGCTIPGPKVEELSDDKLTCDGLMRRAGTRTTSYLWNAETVEGSVNVVVEWGPWTKVRDASTAEKQQLDCPKPPKPDPVVKQLTDDRTDCSGVYHRAGTETTGHVWSAQAWAWIAGEPVTVWQDWTKVRALTNAEKNDLDCAAPGKPADKVTTTTGSRTDCTGVHTRTGTVTTPYIWNATDRMWVLGKAGSPVWKAWTTTRTLTAAERATMKCAAPTRPVGPGHSGDTGVGGGGGGASGAIGAAAALLALAGIGVAAAARRRG